MSRLSIDIVGGKTAFEPGSPIEVDVAWDLDREPAALELRVVWNTAGKGDRDVQTVDVVRIDEPPANGSRRLSLRLPREPYSFSGKLISIIWGLELVALPTGDSTRREITLGPGGKEVQLADSSA